MALASNSFQLPLSFTQVLELIKQLPFEQKKKLAKVLQKETITDPYIIPQEHQDMVLNRINTDKEEDMMDWADARKKLARK